MKRHLLIFLFLCACVQAAVARMFVLSGESNGAGYALNTFLTASEAATRAEVQILNNTNFTFENLLIGTNNEIDVNNGTDQTVHGGENELANSVARGEWPYGSLFVVKTAQFGSTISQWTNTGGAYWLKLVARMDPAVSAQPGLTIAVIHSQGINDMVAGTSAATWQTGTNTYIANFRAAYGSTIHFYLTKFPYPYTAYNATMDAIANASGGLTSVIEMGDAGMRNSQHWSYIGQKVLVRRVASFVLGTQSPVGVWNISPVVWGSPNVGTSTSGNLLSYTSGAHAGAIASTTFDATKSFALQFNIPDATTTQDVVMALDPSNGSNFTWSAGLTFLGGMSSHSGSLNFHTSGSTSSGIGTFGTYPSIGRIYSFDTDLVYAYSNDGGMTYEDIYDQHAALVGQTTLYLREVFASPGAGQQVAINYGQPTVNVDSNRANGGARVLSQ